MPVFGSVLLEPAAKSVTKGLQDLPGSLVIVVAPKVCLNAENRERDCARVAKGL
jgi:hypothetical protein